jgi:DNA processing protein
VGSVDQVPLCEAGLGLACLAAEGSRVFLARLADGYPATTLWRGGPRELRGLEVGRGGVAEFLSRRAGVSLGRRRSEIRRHGLTFLPHGCPGYPVELHQLAFPPAGLFVAGSPARLAGALAGPRVTIVGTRTPTPYGLAVASALARAFAEQGVTVVSGLALGIDGRAHESALAAGGSTIAVLGTRPERAYPAGHRQLYERVKGSGGVLSEFPPGFVAAKWTFPWRNRLLAALGDAVFVVEGGPDSGALRTADCALELGREVFAVPGHLDVPAQLGCLRLIYQGAWPVLTAKMAVEDFFRSTRMARGRHRRTAAEVKVADAPAPHGLRVQDGLLSDERPEDHLVARALVGRVCGVDELALATGLSPGEASAACSRLEVRGRAVRAGPGCYTLNI